MLFSKRACAWLVVATWSARVHAEPRVHQGLYFQGAIGPGFADAWQTQSPNGQSLRAFSAAGSLLAGGSLFPGLVLGGGTFGAVGLAPSGKLAAGSADTIPVPAGSRSLSLELLGVFGDYYPDPRAGFHLQAAVGYAQLSAKQNANALTTDPKGLGFALGGGKDFWVNDSWSIGALGRVLYAMPSYHRLHYAALVPSVLLSFTWY